MRQNTTSAAVTAASPAPTSELRARVAPGAAHPSPPTFLSVRGMCDRLDVSESTFHRIRDEEWMPRPIVLSPKVCRWSWAEVEEALRKRAPRLAVGANAEPENLAAVRPGRKFRSGAPA